MKITITCDSACDLSKEQLSKNKINLMPLSISLGDESYADSVDILPKDIFAFVQKHRVLPKTSAINEFQYTEFFTENLRGFDALIHFTLSSEISSCYNNAIKAAENFDNVYIINSLSLSSGIGLQVLYACLLREKNYEVKEIVEKVEARKQFVQASFIVERLDYLYKGGRCTGLQLFGANLLKIRPSIKVTSGKMSVHKKYRGKMEEVVIDYVKDALKEFTNYDNSLCFITYSTATPAMIANTRKTLQENSTFKNIVETTAGCTITSHCGENTLGILYYGNIVND